MKPGRHRLVNIYQTRGRGDGPASAGLLGGRGQSTPPPAFHQFSWGAERGIMNSTQKEGERRGVKQGFFGTGFLTFFWGGGGEIFESGNYFPPSQGGFLFWRGGRRMRAEAGSEGRLWKGRFSKGFKTFLNQSCHFSHPPPTHPPTPVLKSLTPPPIQCSGSPSAHTPPRQLKTKLLWRSAALSSPCLRPWLRSNARFRWPRAKETTNLSKHVSDFGLSASGHADSRVRASQGGRRCGAAPIGSCAGELWRTVRHASPSPVKILASLTQK